MVVAMFVLFSGDLVGAVFVEWRAFTACFQSTHTALVEHGDQHVAVCGAFRFCDPVCQAEPKEVSWMFLPFTVDSPVPHIR